MKEVNIDAIIKELNSDVKKGLQKSSKETAKEALAMLRKKSPRRTGKYAKGWKQRKVKDQIILYNEDRGWLTHILEKPHALRNGGMSKPQVHIKPVDEWVQEQAVKNFEEELK